MKEITLSITQINNYIKNIIDAEEMLFGINVFGEVTNFKLWSKASYFDLKDESSVLSCVVFDSSILNDIKNGDKVTVKGHLNYSVKIGKLSFVVSKIESFGMGELYQKYVQLKESLEKEGVFDARFKKQLKEVSKRIGVVSSETGAVIHDIIKVARSKNESVDIVLFPVKVQGQGSLDEIINGIKFFDDYDVDCIIVARGGGSFEDYAPFNSEKIVRCVFECKKPIISAVGHENDWTLIDFVADVRASTPSVASEIAVFDLKKYRKNFASTVGRIYSAPDRIISQRKLRISSSTSYILARVNNVVSNQVFILKGLSNRVYVATTSIFENSKNSLEIVTAKIERTNPIAVLKRGFSRTSKNGKSVRSIHEIVLDDEVDITFFDGNANAKIIKIMEKKL